MRYGHSLQNMGIKVLKILTCYLKKTLRYGHSLWNTGIKILKVLTHWNQEKKSWDMDTVSEYRYKGMEVLKHWNQ